MQSDVDGLLLDLRDNMGGLIDQAVCIADFLAQVPTGELPERLRDMIFDYIEVTSHRDGEKRWLPHNVDAFTIESRPKPYA